MEWALPRGRHGLTREQVVRSQQRRLLDAMVRAVAENGYARTSVADVIRRAGVSRETFYEQFGGKEECFLASYDAAVAQMLQTMTGAYGNRADDPFTRFDRGLSAYLRCLAERPDAARTFLIEVYAGGPAALERKSQLQGRFAEGIIGVFGARSPRDRFACEALVAAISAMATTRVAAGRTGDLPELYEPLMDLSRRMLGDLAGPA